MSEFRTSTRRFTYRLMVDEDQTAIIAPGMPGMPGMGSVRLTSSCEQCVLETPLGAVHLVRVPKHYAGYDVFLPRPKQSADGYLRGDWVVEACTALRLGMAPGFYECKVIILREVSTLKDELRRWRHG